MRVMSPLAAYHNILIPHLYLPMTRLIDLELGLTGKLLCILDELTLNLLLVMNLILMDTKEAIEIITQAYIYDILKNILLYLREEGFKLSSIHLQATIITTACMIEGRVKM